MNNRRKYPRLDIDHPVTLIFQGQPISGCRIRNFSEGGVYLYCGDTSLNELLPDGYFGESERQEAVLEVASCRVHVAIVYLHNHGVGICMLDSGEGQQLFSYLQSELQQQETKQVSFDQAAVAPVIQQLQDRLLDYLNPQIAGFLNQSREALLVRAREPSDGLQESVLFLAMSALEQGEQKITAAFLNNVESSFGNLSNLAGISTDSNIEISHELELVEKVEIDHWVVINDIARRAESGLARSLYLLDMSLSYLMQCTIKDESNPLSPVSLLNAIKQAVDEYDLDVKCFHLILTVFHRTVLQGIEPLYDELLELLKQQGIDLTSDGRINTWQFPSHKKTNIATVGEPLQHLTTLLDAKQLREKDPSVSDQIQIETEQVVESLNRMPLRHGSPLLKQLERGLESQSAQSENLDPVIRAAISTGEQLVAALLQDSHLPAELKGLLNRMEIPIIQELVRDPTLLENSNHPVRHMLATIEAITPYLNISSKAVRLRNLAGISQLLEAIDTDKLTSVVEVTKALEALKQKQLEQYHRNRQIAVSRCKKDELLLQAKRSVIAHLRHQLSGKSVTIALEKLFQFGWVNLLVQTRALQGDESPAWKAYLRVVEILPKLFLSKASPHEMSESRVRDLISLIRKGFREYPVHPQGSRSFAIELQQALINGGETATPYFEQQIVIDEAYLSQYISSEEVPIGNTESEDDQKSLEKVVALNINDWIVTESGGPTPQMLNLAWKSADSTRYLLVDGDGLKALDVSSSELVRLFASYDYGVMQNKVQPIVDRAIDRILIKSYNEIKDESSIDELTGLMNRRSFERHMRELLAEMKSGYSQHVLILLDLDQFQVVNDLCGFEGGDQLLQTVSSILLSYLTEDGVVARIGDDEFALLVRNADLDKGYQTAESQRRAIEEYRFTWEDRLIPVSASLGVVQINAQEQTSTSELLQSALSACHMAKEGGRNCTRLYVASDTAYQNHKQIIQTIPAIQEALANDRMVLFAQPIVPLKKEAGLKPHYELLLRIVDDAGELQSPQTFIQIAEQYDLMRAVDRWVIEHFFNALIPYQDKLGDEVSFSVNLSTKSVADSDFKKYLHGRIAESPVAAQQLGFEITETALARNIEDTVEFMKEVRDMGCSCYLDDFGSGYASFSYLKDFPVNYVKIDGIFVREMIQKTADLAMVISIMELAHFMDKLVIAEHVSDASIGQALQEMGVDYAQGYHFGRPQPFAEVLEEIAGNSLQISSA
ncbi:MAG: DUF1631 family protein [Candidatus Thiodiazotropha sp. (ex Lucinoma borealis)]|nr:DUF1631 family protein [Candidatus Thiodiazotropha sp. (ex Lucinoma borealis)]MCU7867231.1 DUF1631 family protein [Candidatus Thiodiazotropha sp. (ex Lucinoma borealis)]